MTPRDDSILYTGTSSRSFAQVKEQKQRTQRREQNNEKRIKLSPVGQILQEEFKKEVHLLIYSPYENEDQMSDEQFRTERRARRIAVEALTKINNRLNTALRTKDPKTETPNEQ